MNAQTCRLPGERELYPGEPNGRMKQLGGPVTLESFRLIHTDELSWHRDLPILFTFELLRRSEARRISATGNRLLFEAAREMLKTFEPSLHRMYAARGWLSHLPEELANELAKQLANRAKSDKAIKDEVAKWLSGMREGIVIDEAFAFIPQVARQYAEREELEQSFSRYLDYCEYVKSTDMYMTTLQQHRFIVCCARVHDVVFGTYILQPNRA